MFGMAADRSSARQLVRLDSEIVSGDAYTKAEVILSALATFEDTESSIDLYAYKTTGYSSMNFVLRGASAARNFTFYGADVIIDNIGGGGNLRINALTDGYIPYHVSDAAGLANSVLRVDANGLSGALIHATNYPYMLMLSDTAAAAADIGGGIGFGGKYSGGAYTKWAGIQGYKTGAAGTWGGGLKFFTRVDGEYNFTERMRILEGGSVLIGATAVGFGDEKVYIHGEAAADGLVVDAGASTGTGDYPFVVRAHDLTNQMYVRSDGYGYLRATAWAYGPSNRALKTNIKAVGASLDLIGKLKPSTFDYIDGRKGYVGFIAEDFMTVFPGLVAMEKDGTYSLKTTDLIPYTVSAIQELNAKVTAQGVEIELLKKAIADMKKRAN